MSAGNKYLSTPKDYIRISILTRIYTINLYYKKSK